MAESIGERGQSPMRRRWPPLVLGIVLGGGAALLLLLLVGMPLAVGHRNNLPLEALYGDGAVGLASRLQGGDATNPVAQNTRAIQAGREAYTGSCAICHGANGDGAGALGQALYPPATDLRGHDTQEKSDAQLFWIIKNGLSFAGMPGFASQYKDQDIWALVAYTRSLGGGGSAALPVPTATGAQLAVADPAGDPAARGSAVYFAQGCQNCHGAVGNAPGELGLRANEREAVQAIRNGRSGMPAYQPALLPDPALNDLLAYLNTFGGTPRR
jgi:mono/diheme cytochrome c family protein